MLGKREQLAFNAVRVVAFGMFPRLVWRLLSTERVGTEQRSTTEL